MIQRIRTLQCIARNMRAIPRGTVLYVPDDIDEVTAQSWLKGGLAEEDKMMDRIPEIKVGPNVTIKVSEMPIKKGKKKRS